MGAMRIRLGRMNFDAILNISSMRLDGDRLSISGKIVAENATELAARREQILGLRSTLDARFLPIYCPDEPWFTGWYTDVETSISVSAGDLPLLRHEFSLTATMLPGRDAPGLELLQVGGFRANDHGLLAASMQPWVAVPEDVEDWWDGVNSDDFDLERKATDGDVGLSFYATGLDRRVASFSLPPHRAFQSAPTLSIAGEDGTLHVVTGRGLFDSNASNAWTLSNGLTEISASGPHLTVRNRFIDGSGWDTTRSYEFRFTVLADVINPFTRRTVVRNTDHTVTARFTGGGGGGLARHSLDLTLRRGARQVECVWRTDYGELMWVGRATVDTATDLTVAGVDVGVVEASGTSLFHIVTPLDFVPDTDGGLNPDGDCSAFPFCIGWTGFFPVSGDGPSDHAAQYLAPMGAWMRAVGR